MTRFDEILPLWQFFNSLWDFLANLVFGKLLYPAYFNTFYATGQFFNDVNGQRLINNDITIWSQRHQPQNLSSWAVLNWQLGPMDPYWPNRGLTEWGFGQPSLKAFDFGLTEGDISWKIWSIIFARVEMTKWSSCLLTEKSSQLGSQNKKTACYVTDETNVIEF